MELNNIDPDIKLGNIAHGLSSHHRLASDKSTPYNICEDNIIEYE